LSGAEIRAGIIKVCGRTNKNIESNNKPADLCGGRIKNEHRRCRYNTGYQMKYYLLVILSILILSLDSLGQTKSKLTMKQAKEKAELFVVEQGYTNLPATQDTLKIVRELVDWDSIDKIINHRHNMLESSAIYAKLIKGGWLVAFRYNQANKLLNKIKLDFKRSGRAVTMDVYGEKIRRELKVYFK
jgi:hypothetical protein